MSDGLRVATRKGLFTFRNGSGGWTAGPPAFLGEPVTAVLTDPRDGAVYAALRLGHFGCKLHRSDDGGATWEELPAPAYPPAPEGAAEAPALDMIWTLAAGGPDAPGEIWAGTLPGGLFVSRDRGASWALLTALWDRAERAEWFGGGYDHPGIHSILVDPRDPDRLTVGISCGGVWKSDDRGASWRLAGKGLRAAFMPPERAYDQNIQDPHLVSACAADPDVMWVQHHNGIFRSTDAGETFAEIDPAPPSGFGFAVAAHPGDPLTAWFAPAVTDECRVPLDGRFVVARTRDGGASFEPLAGGLPQEASWDLVYRHALVVDGAGTRLAMGSTTGNLWISDDAGETWAQASGHLPPIAQVAFAS
jgi:hypothetical protein